MMIHNVQIVVVGAGPAGAVIALVLARLGHEVLLVCGTTNAEFQIGEALPPAARPLLRDLGLLEQFLADGHLPCYGNVSAWGSEIPAVTDFILDPNGHGWHLDRLRFDASLRTAAANAGAIAPQETRVTSAVRREDGWQVRLAAAAREFEELRCRWLIDATGRRSFVARQAGAMRCRDDLLVAFHARFRAASSESPDRDTRTLVESGPDGWCYASIVPSGERVIAYLTDSDLVDSQRILSPIGFIDSLLSTRHIRQLLTAHHHNAIDFPRGTDASAARLDHFHGPGWVAVGDAALSFDPISSQGLFTALYTGLRAGEAVSHSIAGDNRALAQYEIRLNEIWRAYHRHRAIYYRAERRWSACPFWKRRYAIT
jgi:flavin-dependent dehydrogenase